MEKSIYLFDPDANFVGWNRVLKHSLSHSSRNRTTVSSLGDQFQHNITLNNRVGTSSLKIPESSSDAV